MHLPTSSGKLGFAVLAFLAGAAGSLRAAPPTITSPTTVDLYYDAETPGDSQFAYRIVATDAAATFEASGLPPDAIVNPLTGWINGSRKVPGTYDVAIRATNADGTGTATVRLAIHPTATGVVSSQGVFHSGQTVSVTLHYNAAVVVTGVPRLVLAIGPAGATSFKDAAYVSGTGSSELIFQYTVTAGDDDPDGVQILPAAPAGGTICEASGLEASPSLPVRHFVSGLTISGATGGGPVAGAASESAAAATVGSQLMNVSSRSRVVAGDVNRSPITGFVIAGAAPKRVLLRVIGPALTALGVQGALSDPGLSLYASGGGLVAENDNWSGAETKAVAIAVGAFGLAEGTRDAAIVVTLPPGAYSMVVSAQGSDGVALAEVYDADIGGGAGASEIVNLSTRGYVGPGEDALIAGFVVQGDRARRVLVRGIGPALAKMGVGAVLSDPILKIYQGGRLVAQNDDWSGAAAEVSAAATMTGAFALAAESKDAAMVVTLDPGAYTAVVSGAGETAGTALVEVYALPAGS